jgi:hypothetical protein
MTGSCETCNEFSVSVKRGNILDQLRSNLLTFKKYSASLSKIATIISALHRA